jgi:hypothetical protein
MGFAVAAFRVSIKAFTAERQADSVPYRMAPLELTWLGGYQ